MADKTQSQPSAEESCVDDGSKCPAAASGDAAEKHCQDDAELNELLSSNGVSVTMGKTWNAGVIAGVVFGAVAGVIIIIVIIFFIVRRFCRLSKKGENADREETSRDRPRDPVHEEKSRDSYRTISAYPDREETSRDRPRDPDCQETSIESMIESVYIKLHEIDRAEESICRKLDALNRATGKPATTSMRLNPP